MNELFNIGVENYQKKYREAVSRFGLVDIDTVLKQSKIEDLGNVFSNDMDKLLILCRSISSMAGEVNFGTVQYAAAISVLASYMHVTYTVSCGCCVPRSHNIYERSVADIKAGKSVVPNAVVITVDGKDYAYSLGTNSDVESLQLVSLNK